LAGPPTIAYDALRPAFVAAGAGRAYRALQWISIVAKS
jgi:hypothetical protein